MRSAPAYQEYASDILAMEPYKQMSLAERGLWHAMRLQCWVSGSVPSDPAQLARLLSCDVEEVKMAATATVWSSFTPFPTDPGRLQCIELEEYRVEVEERRKKKAEAGRAGAASRHGLPVRAPAALAAPVTPGADGIAGDPNDIPF